MNFFSKIITTNLLFFYDFIKSSTFGIKLSEYLKRINTYKSHLWIKDTTVDSILPISVKTTKLPNLKLTLRTEKGYNGFLVECLKGSDEKYQLDEHEYVKSNKTKINFDRLISKNFPTYYGAILNSMFQDDGDFMDGFIITQKELKRESILKLHDLEVLSYIEYIDKKELDCKLVFKFKEEDLEDIYKTSELKKIVNFLLDYKLPINNTIDKILIRSSFTDSNKLISKLKQILKNDSVYIDDSILEQLEQHFAENESMTKVTE